MGSRICARLRDIVTGLSSAELSERNWKQLYHRSISAGQESRGGGFGILRGLA